MVGEMSTNIYVFDAKDNLSDTSTYSRKILHNPFLRMNRVMDFTIMRYRRIRREPSAPPT